MSSVFLFIIRKFKRNSGTSHLGSMAQQDKQGLPDSVPGTSLSLLQKVGVFAIPSASRPWLKSPKDLSLGARLRVHTATHKVLGRVLRKGSQNS